MINRPAQASHIRDFIVLMELSRALDLIYTNILRQNNPLVVQEVKQEIKRQQAATTRLLQLHKRLMERPYFERLSANTGTSVDVLMDAHHEEVEGIRAPALLEVAHTFAVLETGGSEMLAQMVTVFSQAIRQLSQAGTPFEVDMAALESIFKPVNP